MSSRLRRRGFIHAAGAFALTPALAGSKPRDWPPDEGGGAPKLCLGTGANADEKEMRRIRQIGVDYVLMGHVLQAGQGSPTWQNSVSF